MKADTGRQKGRKKKLRLHTLWAKPHRFSAHVTEEQDWHTEVPNVRLARVFGIVLILHVVAVGGILAFKMIEKSSTVPERVSTAPEAEEAAGAPEAVPAAPKAIDYEQPDVNIIVDDPSRLGMKHYRVRSGDNLLEVAMRLGVSVSEIEELNKLDKGNELYAGQVLLVPNRKISALPAEDIQRLLGEPIPDQIIKAETGAVMEGVVEKVELIVETAQKSVPAAAPVVKPAVPLEGSAANAPILKPLPAEAPAAPVVERPRAEPAVSAAPVIGSTANTKSYVVQPGDTPYGIARRFGVDFNQLMKVNGIADPTLLKVGAELRIP